MVLNTDTKLYYYQLDSREHDVVKGDTVVGEMTQSPMDPKKWGLRNLTNDNWHYTSPGGTMDVYPGKAVSLLRDISIDFGSAKAEIII